jgi:hypothetical protein
VTADSLLVWMSARGCGSWQQFRAAVEELQLAESNASPQGDADDTGTYGLPLYQLLRLNVQRLGHAEFFTGADNAEWRIVPPAVAISGRGPDALGVLTGARSPAMMRRFEAACSGHLQSSSVDDYPTQFTIRAAVPDLIWIADRTGLVVQHDAPLLILLSLPLVDDMSAYRCTELPFGAAWTVERFSTSTLGWKPATREEAIAGAGLFRFSFRHERRVFYHNRGVATELGAQTGKYIVLKRRRRRVFEYDRSSHTVAVRPSCRPPFLIERALILCSGLPPDYDPRIGRLVYGDVPEDIGPLAAQLLRQDF